MLIIIRIDIRIATASTKRKDGRETATIDPIGDYSAGTLEIGAGRETGTAVMFVLTGINPENPI
jgi:hypothetical protein